MTMFVDEDIEYYERLPVFVYGTLRLGQHNHERIFLPGSIVRAERATIYGVGVHLPYAAFPFATEHSDPHAQTVGELYWLTGDDLGDYVRDCIDALEGFVPYEPPTFYKRVLWDAYMEESEENPVRCWLYLAASVNRVGLDETNRVVSGDWVEERKYHLGDYWLY